MLTIAALTLKEIARRRILLVTLVLAAVFLGLYGTGVYYGYKDMAAHAGTMKGLIAPVLLSLGLYFGSFIVAFLAIMAAVGTISGEIESGAMHAVVPGPIRRQEIVLGKFLGYGLALSIFAALFYIAVLLIVRLDTGMSVPIRAGAVGLFCLQPIILLAVTMFGTTFLSTLANGIGVFMLYAIGVVGGMLEQIGYLANSGVMVKIGIVSSLIMPADAVYRKIVYSLLSAPGVSFATFMMGPFGSGTEPSAWMLAYTGLYMLIFLLLAMKVFASKDI